MYLEAGNTAAASAATVRSIAAAGAHCLFSALLLFSFPSSQSLDPYVARKNGAVNALCPF